MKRFLACLLTLALLLGCVSFASAEEQATVRIVWWGSQTRHDLTVAALEKFMEKYPNIKVEYEFSDWGGYWSKLATQVAGHLEPDVICMDYSQLANYANSGVLADLAPYMESGALDVSNVASSVIDSGKIGDKTYALSTGTNAFVMFYRPDVVEEAGLTMPETISYEDYLEMSKTIYEKTGRTGEAMLGIDRVRNTARGYGDQMYNDDGSALGFDNPEYLVKVWTAYTDAVNAGWQLPVGEGTAATAFDAFVSDTWSSSHWTNELTAYEEGSGCELKMVPYPDWADSTMSSTYFKPSMFWTMAESSQNKDAAITLINYLTNDPDAFDILGTDRAMPISSVIREHIAPTLDENSQEVASLLDFLGEEGRTSPIMKPDPACDAEIRTLLDEYTDQVKYDMVDDLYAHAQAFIEEANGILAKAAAK
jgi:multiple sugar transport system substrate-binding protein